MTGKSSPCAHLFQDVTLVDPSFGLTFYDVSASWSDFGRPKWRACVLWSSPGPHETLKRPQKASTSRPLRLQEASSRPRSYTFPILHPPEMPQNNAFCNYRYLKVGNSSKTLIWKLAVVPPCLNAFFSKISNVPGALFSGTSDLITPSVIPTI